MKTFSSAYYTSRKESIAEKTALVEQEHAKIVAAMKKEFGINSFSALNESEKASYRSMLNAMWNKETGLTDKGIKFLNEAAAPLTPESTPEQIKKSFQREIKANVNNYLSICCGNSNSWEDAVKLKNKIEADVNHKLSAKDCKTWIYEIVSAEIAKKVKSIKF